MPAELTPRIAIIVSSFNAEVTEGLRRGALAVLDEHGIAPAQVGMFPAPGAFEMPLLARKAALSGYDGVICLGCVIKGDTAHFEYISEATAHGLMQAGLETGKPIAFGVLTTYTEQQAIDRSQDDAHNKGREAASACLASIAALRAMDGPA